MSPGAWFLLLVGACVVGPYALGVRPRRTRDWVALEMAIVLVCLTTLALIALRSR